MAQNSLLGLDIGTKFIKLLEISEEGNNYLINNFSIQEITKDSDPKELIKEMLNSCKFKKKRIVSSVSGRSVIVRYINMPIMDDQELRKAIKFEASKYIPFEIDEVILDCQKIEENNSAEATTTLGENEMKVLLVAVKSNIVDEHLKLIESFGFIPDILDVDGFALGNAFSMRWKVNSSLEPPEKTLALINIGASKTNINIMDKLTSHFTREFYIGGNDFTESISKKLGIDMSEAEILKRDPGERISEVNNAINAVMDDLSHEIHLSFDYFENQYDKNIDDLLLSGGMCKYPNFEDLFEVALDKKPQIWDPVELLDVNEENVDQIAMKEYSSSLAIAAGLAARVIKD